MRKIARYFYLPGKVVSEGVVRLRVKLQQAAQQAGGVAPQAGLLLQRGRGFDADARHALGCSRWLQPQQLFHGGAVRHGILGAAFGGAQRSRGACPAQCGCKWVATCKRGC